MNNTRFDDLTRLLATGATRRQVVKALGGAALAGLLGLSGAGPSWARAGRCDPAGHHCSNTNGNCCSGLCCNGTCCETSGVCCGEGHCCAPGSTCASDGEGDDFCCPPGTVVRRPYPNNDGPEVCCDPARATLAYCCADSTTPVADLICCPNAQVCGANNRACCGDGTVCCPNPDGTKGCADLQSNFFNCGACGNACPTGWTCQSGQCQNPCPDGNKPCGTLTDGKTVNCIPNDEHCCHDALLPYPWYFGAPQGTVCCGTTYCDPSLLCCASPNGGGLCCDATDTCHADSFGRPLCCGGDAPVYTPDCGCIPADFKCCGYGSFCPDTDQYECCPGQNGAGVCCDTAQSLFCRYDAAGDPFCGPRS